MINLLGQIPKWKSNEHDFSPLKESPSKEKKKRREKAKDFVIKQSEKHFNF